jgi:hypothetical protein
MKMKKADGGSTLVSYQKCVSAMQPAILFSHLCEGCIFVPLFFMSPQTTVT